jgi:HK97 family phage major capsid protein
MPSNTSTFSAILTPEQVGQLVVTPLTQLSIAGQTMTTVHTSSHNYRIPIVTADPSASFVPEAGEIPVTDAAVTELNVTPSKLAALSVISRELADDSTPAAAQTIGDGITRDLQRKLDQALFSATTTNGPGGLPGVSGISAVSAGASYANLDPFSDALYTSANNNGTIDSWVTNPATAMTLSKLKAGTALNSSLLQPDPTQPGKRQISGVPLLVSPAVPTANNQVWGIPRDFCYFVIRTGAEILADRSVFFTSDRIALRATMRVGFGFPNPASIAKIATT